MPIHLSHSPLKLMRANTDAEEAQYRVARDRERSMERGISDLGNAFAQIAAVGARYQEQERINYVNKKKVLAYDLFYSLRDEAEQGLTGENAMASAEGLRNKLVEASDKLLEDAPDDRTREVAMMQFGMLGSTIVREYGRTARKAFSDYSEGMNRQAQNDNMKGAYQAGMNGGGPGDLMSFMDAVDTTMESQAKAGFWLDPITAEKSTRAYKQGTVKNYIAGALDSPDEKVMLRTARDLLDGRYNAPEFHLSVDDLLSMGSRASAAITRNRKEREAEAKRAAALAEDAGTTAVLKAALGHIGSKNGPDYGAAAELLMSPTAKDLFKGVPDKVLHRTAQWAISAYNLNKSRQSELQKDVDDSATAVLEGYHLKNELTHEKIQEMANKGASPQLVKQWHDSLDNAAKTVSKEKSAALAANAMTRVSSGEITRPSELVEYRSQGLNDSDYNTVFKHLQSVKDEQEKPYASMTDKYLQGISKTKEDGSENKYGILGPTDVVRIKSILQQEKESGDLKPKDMLKRTQELTDQVYTEEFFKSDRKVYRFEVEPGGVLPGDKKGIEKRDEALELLRTGDKEEQALFKKLYPNGATSKAAEPAQTPTDAAAAPQQGGQDAEYKTGDDVAKAFRAGKITREQAYQIFESHGFKVQ